VVPDVLHRLLDVVFQYLVPLAGALVLLPAVVFSAGLVLDRSSVVTARLWADEPAVLSGSPYTGLSGSETPAAHEATLLTELLQTDSFVASAEMGLGDGSAAGPAGLRAFADDVRHNLVVYAQGPNVIIVTYTTPQADHGVAVTRAVLAIFEQAQAGAQIEQVTVADDALSSELKTAKREMDDAVAAARQYETTHDLTALQTDATYQSLRALATAKVQSYTSLVQANDRASQYQSAIPSVQTTLLRTVDPPRAAPSDVNLVKGPATKNALYALVAVLVVELVFVYNLTRRDQRVRTPHDVVAALGLLPLGTVPEPWPTGR
jgi:hypothetical protein